MFVDSLIAHYSWHLALCSCAVPNKNKKFCKEGYPVIVMDFLEGGDLFGMVINR